MIDFDNEDTLHGFYASVCKLIGRVRGHRLAWWYEHHPILGCSPLSALCDDRFADVHLELTENR